jgi:hypothetical protein
MGDIIEATVSITAFAAGLIGSVTAPHLPPLPAAGTLLQGLEDDGPVPLSPLQEWEKEDPDGDASRLKNAVLALRDLHDRLVSDSRGVGTSKAPARAYRRLLAVEYAIGILEREIAAINARQLAWFNSRYLATESHRFHLATDEAFRLSTPGGVPPPSIWLKNLADGSDTTKAVLEHLRLAVVEIRSPDSDLVPKSDRYKTTENDLQGELPPGIYFRIPRSAIIALYKEKDDSDSDNADEKRELLLESVDRYWVADKDSWLGSMPLKGGDGNLTTAATFSSSGFLESASQDVVGKLELFIEALKGVPAGVAAGIGQAKTASEAWSSLRASRIDRELSALDKRKQQLELEIGNRGLAADASSQATLQELRDKLDRLKVEKEIGAATAPVASDDTQTEDERRQKLAARLETELAIMRAQHEFATPPGNGTLKSD